MAFAMVLINTVSSLWVGDTLHVCGVWRSFFSPLLHPREDWDGIKGLNSHRRREEETKQFCCEEGAGGPRISIRPEQNEGNKVMHCNSLSLHPSFQ